MGTRVDIIGWGGDGMAIVNAIVEVVARHEDLWSVFRVSSEVSRLNAAVRGPACSHDARGGEALSPTGDACRDAAHRAASFADCMTSSASVTDTPNSSRRHPQPSREGTSDAEAGPGLVVSEETDRLLRDALVLAEATGGAFNPMIGPLVVAWDIKAMRAAYVAGRPLPPAPAGCVVEAALRASSWDLLSRVGERRWAVGAPAESVGGAEVPSPRLDLGGIAKGYTADACRDLAVSMGARGVLVSVGTSSVSVSGSRADGSPWSCLRVAWRPCRRPGTTWGRWVVCVRFVPGPRRSVRRGLRRCTWRVLWRSPCWGARVKHRVKHPRVAGNPSLVLAVHR